MAIHVIARFDVQPAQLGAATDILRALVDPIRRDAGCLRCNLVVDKENPAVFLYVEEWRDEAALELHLQDPEVLRMVGLVAPLLSQPFAVSRYADA